LSAMAPADEGFALLALIACDGLVDYGDDQIRGFALTRLPPRRKGAIAETDDDAADDEAPARTDVKRVIEPTDAATTVEALSEYRNEPAIIYLPKRATDEMHALADSLGDIFRRAGFTVEQRSWRTSSCRRPEYDLALIGNQPATPAELAVGLRLTLTKLHTFVCQSANAEPDKLGVLVLPPHR